MQHKHKWHVWKSRAQIKTETNTKQTSIDKQREMKHVLSKMFWFSFLPGPPAARVFCFHTVSLSQSLSELISVSQRCSVLVFSVTVQFSSVFSFQCLSVRRRVACCVLRVVCCVLVCVCVCVDGGLWIRRWCSPISTSRLVLVLVTRYKLSRVELSQVEPLSCWSWSHRESLSRWVGLLSCWVVEVDRWSWSHRFSAEMKT